VFKGPFSGEFKRRDLHESHPFSYGRYPVHNGTLHVDWFCYPRRFLDRDIEREIHLSAESMRTRRIPR
jgi:hypothetical protein